MSKNVKIIINNWLGKVSFEIPEHIIPGFIEDYQWEYDENNHTIESMGNGFAEPYEDLDSSGEFVVISKYSVWDEEINGTGYEFEFINCDCPIGLEEYMDEDGWVFVDDYDKLIKDNDHKSKFSEMIEEMGYEIDNDGSGCLRLSDFNYKEFFDFIGAKEPD